MKQRSLVNSKPWVFIGPESMPDDDNYLAEQQLKQDMARGRPPKQVPEPTTTEDGADCAEWVNVVAVKNIKKDPATATGPGKRKRGQSPEDVIEEKSSKRRIMGGEVNITESRGAGKAGAGKLPRPSKPPRQTGPAVKKNGDDVFDFSQTAEPLKNNAVIVQMPNDTSRRNGTGGSAKGTKNTQLTTETTVPAEGHSSAIFNGRANVTEKPGRGRPKTKTTNKTSGIKTNASGKDDATLEETGANEEQVDLSLGELADDVNMTDPDDDDENGQRSFDLLGFGMDWQKILKAARSVGGLNLPENRIPTLQTETIKVLISEVIEARTLYENGPYDKPMDDLHELLITIEDRIKHDSISEAKAFNKKSQMIRDIYARAIPALVFLLESAFSFYALHPKGLRRYEALQDIVRLQDMIISLSMKAKIWKAKPNTDKPIIKQTKGTILPYTREMKKVFEMELRELKRKWKISQNASKTAGSEDELAEYSQKQRELSIMETNQCFARGLPHIQRAREIFRASRKPIGTLALQFSQENDVTHHSTHWNAEEEKELMRQLQFGYASDQSGRCFKSLLYLPSFLTILIAEVRYLAILNTRLLQNKLPERVREKALELKPFLKEEYGACDWIESIS